MSNNAYSLLPLILIVVTCNMELVRKYNLHSTFNYNDIYLNVMQSLHIFLTNGVITSLTI